MDMNFEELTQLTTKWAKNRNLIKGATPHSQVSKLLEEFGELASGINKNNMDKIEDSLGDMLVVMTIISEIYNLPLDKCFNRAYIEIKGRKGRMINNVFVKEEDLKESL